MTQYALRQRKQNGAKQRKQQSKKKQSKTQQQSRDAGLYLDATRRDITSSLHKFLGETSYRSHHLTRTFSIGASENDRETKARANKNDRNERKKKKSACESEREITL